MNTNLEYKKYLRKLKLSTVKVIFIQFLILILFITLWQFLSDKNIINSFLCSSPKNIVKQTINLIKENGLFIHILVTLKEILISFILGSIIGILVAAILWWSPFLSKVLDPYLTILNSLPKIALGPIIIIWAGANQNSIILMALLISVISTIISVYTGFVNTNPISIKLLRSFKANKVQIFTKVIIPSNINTIIFIVLVLIGSFAINVLAKDCLSLKLSQKYSQNFL